LQSIEPAAGQETQAIDLKMSALKWKRRPLLIFTPGESAEAFRQQTARLGELRSQIQERDMAVIQVVADQGGSVDGRPLTEAAVDRLRAAYQVAPDEFAVILVGKDATVKLRHEQPVAWRQIFRLIDSMPMRQREMRR
jgi:hypothetical protein